MAEFAGGPSRESVTLALAAPADGRRLRERCLRPTGIWVLPLTREEQATKAGDCPAHLLPAEQSSQVQRLLRGLPSAGANDVRELMDILRTSPAGSG